MSENENIKCYIRCRPLNINESTLGANCLEINSNSISLKTNDDRIFTFDDVFSETTNQEKMFNEIGLPAVKNFLSGYNSTIFVYGQTGSGKTHTMLGPIDVLYEKKNEFQGLIPNILNYLFNNKENVEKIIKNSLNEQNSKLKYNFSCSCIEIYNEQIIDLLSEENFENKLTIREDAKKGMFIENLTEKNIENDINAKETLIFGLKNRHVASTNMNSESSRSHLIYTLFLEANFEINDGLIITHSSRLHLVDLAGSERQKFTNAIGERIKEAGKINKSLSILGNVINALIEFAEGKTKFVPFRDSKLTFYLKDSLGGNSKTVVIGNVSQSFVHLQETASTLNFVQRAKMIKNRVEKNENVNDSVKMLKNEIKRLKNEIEEMKNNKISGDKISGENNKISSENNKISSENNEIRNLFEKINHLFSFESKISEHFQFLDINIVSTIENFLIQKEIYENEMKNTIESLPLNEIFIKEIKNSDSLNDKIKIFNLLIENKKIRQELEVYKTMSQWFIKQNDLEESKKKINNDIINQFILTNKELKNFFVKNFDRNYEYVMIEKNNLDKLNYQIEEFKIQEEILNKKIDDLENENFLLNMELTKFRENENNNENNENFNENNENNNENKFNAKEQFAFNLRSSIRASSISFKDSFLINNLNKNPFSNSNDFFNN